MIDKKNTEDKLKLISDYWNPKIVEEFNDHQIRLVKFKGELCYHKHEEEDEVFFVLKGSIQIDLKNKIITLNQGEFLKIPRGIIHKPIAEKEAEVMMIVKSSNLNTGDVNNSMTKENLEKI